MIHHRAVASFSLLALALLTAGCSMTTLPSYDTARDETRAALQDLVEALPDSAEVSDDGTERPYPCGDGFFYTGHWTVRLPADFDTAGFVEGLPESAGDAFELADAQGPSDSITYVVATQRQNTRVAVSDESTTDQGVLDLLATSRCAQPPESKQE